MTDTKQTTDQRDAHPVRSNRAAERAEEHGAPPHIGTKLLIVSVLLAILAVTAFALR